MEYKGKQIHGIDEPIPSVDTDWTPYKKKRVEDFIKANLPHPYYEDEWDEMTPNQQQSIIDSGEFIVILEGSRPQPGPQPDPPTPPTPEHSVLNVENGKLLVSGSAITGTARITGVTIDGKLILSKLYD